MDGGRTHDNAQVITLTLKRTQKPALDGSVWETVENVTPEWDGNTYTFSELPRFADINDVSTEYEYKVEETAVNVTEGEEGSERTVSYRQEADGFDSIPKLCL